jgi:hypothetical protein
LLFYTDVNILSGNGEHALHIVAQSKAIWMKNEKTTEPKREDFAKKVNNFFLYIYIKINI